MFVDLDWPLNASSLLSASAELLVGLPTRILANYCHQRYTAICGKISYRCTSTSSALTTAWIILKSFAAQKAAKDFTSALICTSDDAAGDRPSVDRTTLLWLLRRRRRQLWCYVGELQRMHARAVESDAWLFDTRCPTTGLPVVADVWSDRSSRNKLIGYAVKFIVVHFSQAVDVSWTRVGWQMGDDDSIDMIDWNSSTSRRRHERQWLAAAGVRRQLVSIDSWEDGDRTDRHRQRRRAPGDPASSRDHSVQRSTTQVHGWAVVQHQTVAVDQ